jgi:hypothetical protein
VLGVGQQTTINLVTPTEDKKQTKTNTKLKVGHRSPPKTIGVIRCQENIIICITTNTYITLFEIHVGYAVHFGDN